MATWQRCVLAFAKRRGDADFEFVDIAAWTACGPSRVPRARMAVHARDGGRARADYDLLLLNERFPPSLGRCRDEHTRR
jgi:hypothetical protein